MAMITCTECGKEFSDKAKECPNCGCPVEYVLSNIKENNKESEKKKNIVYEYNILDTKLVVDEELNNYLKVLAELKIIQSEYIDAVKQYYHKAKNIDSLIESLPDYIAAVLDKSLDGAISVLIKNEIYELDKNTFYQKYETQIDVSRIITPLIDQYLEIIEYQDQVHQYHDYVRTVHKNRWSGGGFGIEGALKGHIKAELMNMGSSFISSFAVYCKIKLPNVAKQKWTMLHVQIGQCCNLLHKGSQERL